MKYLYSNGAEILNGDLFTSSIEPNYARLLIMYKEGDVIRYKSLITTIMHTVPKSKFVPLRDKQSTKNPDISLLMRKEEWLKLLGRLLIKAKTIELEPNYTIPQRLIDIWTRKIDILKH